jgi:hypothetical protein
MPGKTYQDKIDQLETQIARLKGRQRAEPESLPTRALLAVAHRRIRWYRSRVSCEPVGSMRGSIQRGVAGMKRINVRLTEGSLRSIGIDLVGFPSVHLACRACGQHFSPLLETGGRLPRGWWQCPTGCNVGTDKPAEEGEARQATLPF